jgi:MFS family permease
LVQLAGAVRNVIIIRNGSFGLLWTGQLLSSTGSWLLLVAVPVYVFHLTDSATATGLTVVAEVAPLLAVGPIAGAFADRWPRRRTMVIVDLLRAGCVGVLMLVTSPGQLWLVLVAVFAENCGDAFFNPACAGLVPAVVGRGQDLAVANAWSAFSGGVVRLAGAPLGGALYAAGGFRLPVAVDAASYLVSALLIWLTRVPSARMARGLRPAGTRPSETYAPGRAYLPEALPASRPLRALAGDLRGGLTALRADRVLTNLLTVSGLFLLGNGALTALLVPYVVADLGVRAAAIGGLFSALGVGYLLSAWLARRANAGPRLRRTVTGLLGMTVLGFAGLFDWHNFTAAFGFIALAGLGGGAFLTVERTVLQRRAPADIVGRISATYSTVVMAATLVGALLGSVLAASVGLTAAVNAAITVIALASIAGLQVSPPEGSNAGSSPARRSYVRHKQSRSVRFAPTFITIMESRRQ